MHCTNAIGLSVLWFDIWNATCSFLRLASERRGILYISRTVKYVGNNLIVIMLKVNFNSLGLKIKARLTHLHVRLHLTEQTVDNFTAKMTNSA